MSCHAYTVTEVSISTCYDDRKKRRKSRNSGGLGWLGVTGGYRQCHHQSNAFEFLFPFIQTAPVFLAVCESYFVESRQYYPRWHSVARLPVMALCLCDKLDRRRSTFLSPLKRIGAMWRNPHRNRWAYRGFTALMTSVPRWQTWRNWTILSLPCIVDAAAEFSQLLPHRRASHYTDGSFRCEFIGADKPDAWNDNQTTSGGSIVAAVDQPFQNRNSKSDWNSENLSKR